jgi:4-amino-4-deoxy-L-arabinose transferase-like glycosyltransferase
VYVAGHESATFDEVPHIAAGVRYLAGDLRLNPEHPPLVKALAAAALPVRDPPLPLPARALPTNAQWTYGAAWLHGARQDPLTLLLRARLPLLLLASALLFCVALWTDRLAGAVAAGAAVWGVATSPLWIAHSALVTTDAAATVFFFAAAYSGYRLARAPRDQRLRRSAWLAVFLALAVASKYSMLAAVILVPLGVALDALWLRRRDLLIWTAGAALAGALVGVLFAWGLPPRPGQYLAGAELVVRGELQEQRPMYYAFGSFFHGQEPLYFVRALFVKLSAPVLLLCALSPWLVRRRPLASAGEAGERRFTWLLVVPPVGYFALMAACAPAIGVRYVLPILPFLVVLAGIAAAGLWRRASLRWWLAPLAAAQLLAFADALRATPLAYFNGLGCSTGESLPCLDDSNLDWGQALPDLKRFRDERFPKQTLRLFYFGTSPAEAYVDRMRLAKPEEIERPRRAIYAISLHRLARFPTTAWPRQMQPSEVVGGVYAIFDLRHTFPGRTPVRLARTGSR